METSIRGIELIKHFESLKLEAYVCSGGKTTIGYGTTVYGDSKIKVKLGDKITIERAEELLKIDLNTFEAYIDRYIKVELSQDQFDALVCAVYNLGPVVLNEETSTLARLLNQVEYLKAADQFKWWRKSSGKVLKGLIRRRLSERNLFIGCKTYIYPEFEEWMWNEYK